MLTRTPFICLLMGKSRIPNYKKFEKYRSCIYLSTEHAIGCFYILYYERGIFIGFRATWALKAGKYKMIEEVFSRQMIFKARDLKNYSLENITLDDIFVQGTHEKKDFILK